MDDCIFCKIIRNEIPSARVYEDEHVYAFLDINPVAPGHTLVVPKNHTMDLLEMPGEDIKNVFCSAKLIAKAVIDSLDAEGFNINMNNKETAGQVVMHSHIHIIPRNLGDGLELWHGRKYDEGQIEEIKNKIITKLNDA